MSQHWTLRKTRSEAQPEPVKVARFVERGDVEEERAAMGTPAQARVAEEPGIPVYQPPPIPDSPATGIPGHEDIDIPVNQSHEQPEELMPVIDNVAVLHSVGTPVMRSRSGAKVKVAAYLPRDLGARLRQHCHERNVKISDVIVEALERHLA